MTNIRSNPTDAQEPPVDPVLEAQPAAQPLAAADPELHPEQDPVAEAPEGLRDAEPPEAMT